MNDITQKHTLRADVLINLESVHYTYQVYRIKDFNFFLFLHDFSN